MRRHTYILLFTVERAHMSASLGMGLITVGGSCGSQMEMEHKLSYCTLQPITYSHFGPPTA